MTASPRPEGTKSRRSSKSASSPLVQTVQAATAYNAVLPRLINLAADEVQLVEVEVPKVVGAVLSALSKLRELRATVATQLPHHSLASFDDLENLALATAFAHMREEASGTASPSLDDLIAAGKPLREDLLVAAEVLARRDLLDPARVAQIRQNEKKDDLAGDLAALFELFLWGWGKVQNKTAVTQEEINKAGDLAQKITVALGKREEAAAPSNVTDFLARALTLLARSYDDCVRAAVYLRWHEGDADTFAPSLFSKRKKRGKAAAKEGPQEETLQGESPQESAAQENETNDKAEVPTESAASTQAPERSGGSERGRRTNPTSTA